MIINNTPIEKYQIDKIGDVYVKREDMSCPFPGPSFSKIRGVKDVFEKLKTGGLLPIDSVAVVDTLHSKAGWGVSWLAKIYGFPCTVFYPQYKTEITGELRPYQKLCIQNSAECIPIPATKSAVLWYKARNIMRSFKKSFYLFPNGLKLQESVQSTADEVNYTPKFLMENAFWVISISSATIAAGVLLGLQKNKFSGKVFLHAGYSRSKNEIIRYIYDMTAISFSFDIEIIDEKYEYKDSISYDTPFPCNPFYDKKAWKWMVENPQIFNSVNKIVFWNIGK